MKDRQKFNEGFGKQIINKYDDKNRKVKDARTANVNLRCKPIVKEKLVEMAEKTGKSQADVLEDLVIKGKLIVRPCAKEAVRAIATIDNRLKYVEQLLKSNDITGAEEFIKIQMQESETIKNQLFIKLRKDG